MLKLNANEGTKQRLSVNGKPFVQVFPIKAHVPDTLMNKALREPATYVIYLRTYIAEYNVIYSERF